MTKQDERVICPEHGISDCSPLLNGCSRVIKLHQARERDTQVSSKVRYALDVTWVDALPGLPTLIGPFNTEAEAEEFARLNVTPHPSSATVRTLAWPYMEPARDPLG